MPRAGNQGLPVSCFERTSRHVLIRLLSTLKVFRDGVPADYTGPRKADGIISYMIKYVHCLLKARANLTISQAIPSGFDTSHT